jgi:hypothetical protein
MPSFRTKVLDALDIKKLSTKLNVRETFPCAIDELTGLRYTTDRPSTQFKPYALSETLISKAIGPCNRTIVDGVNVTLPAPVNTLDVLGFVVGEEPVESGTEYKQSLPQCFSRTLTTIPPVTNRGTDRQTATCFHYLNGIYDGHQRHLTMMRKSQGTPFAYDTMFDGPNTVPEHTHSDWPDTVLAQTELLRSNPYADSLFYGSMKLSMLLTGLNLPQQETGSNHRGLVRMLICRPKNPFVKMRLHGAAGTPQLNMSYPHHFDTDLFYSKKKTLGGRLDNNCQIRTENASGDQSHLSPEFGLCAYRKPNKEMNTDINSLHYGHFKPGDGFQHDLMPFDIMTSPINTKAYTVIRDESFHLDTQHHGAAAQKVVNVTIPFNMKVKFAGRLHNANGIDLQDVCNDEPMNLTSRPFIMFLSMDQKISAQVTGYTNVYET